MDKAINIANYICQQYYYYFHQSIDEMKLHKLLYFSQREALALYHQPLFQESMQGWVYGPVLPQLHHQFIITDFNANLVSIKAKMIIDLVIKQYGKYSSWDLSLLTHKETSWLNSRKKLDTFDLGVNELTINDIAIDSKEVRSFDEDWGCFFEEHKDVDW